MSSLSSSEASAYNTLGIYGTKKVVPKGTADMVMERLFPEKRSSVPTDPERKMAVYDILVNTGALEMIARGPVNPEEVNVSTA